MQNVLVADIIRDVVEPDRAASLLRFFKQTGNVRSLHEPEMRGHPPEIFTLLDHRHQIRPMHAWLRFGQDTQHDDAFVKRPIVPQVPQQWRRTN